MRGVISTRDSDPASLIKARQIPHDWSGFGQEDDSCQCWQEEGKFNILVVDCGVKFSILKELAKRNCRVVVYPATSR